MAVFGIIGALRGDELTSLTTENVEDTKKEIIVRIPVTKRKEAKFFVICDKEFVNIVREYSKLRPASVATQRFFLQYRNGKCTKQVMGRNTIAKVPKEIAKFLELPDHYTFTGHGLRRTGTTILADTGVGIETLKRLGPWKSSSTCEGYIQNSLTHKRKLGNLISNSINMPSTSNAVNLQPSDATPSSPKKIYQMPHPIPHPTSAVDDVAVSASGNDVSVVNDVGVSFGTSGNVSVNIPGGGLTGGGTFPFPLKENIIFHFSGQIDNFNVNMKQ